MKKKTIRNFVAKHSLEFNRATVQRDRTKYQRKSKHTGLKETYLTVLC